MSPRIVSKIDAASGRVPDFFVPERDKLFVAVPDDDSRQAEIRHTKSTND
jgi:hypothetical protein